MGSRRFLASHVGDEVEWRNTSRAAATPFLAPGASPGLRAKSEDAGRGAAPDVLPRRSAA